MSEERTNSEEFLGDCWLNPWEDEVIQEIECQSNTHNQRLKNESDFIDQKLWHIFQTAAECVAQMYKGAHDSHNIWAPFQTAAGNITSLYKESMDGIKKLSELGIQTGYHKRSRDIVSWARRKRHIRRDELIAFLAGKSPPPRSSHLRNSPRTRIALDRMSPRLPSPHSAHSQHESETDLSNIREAMGFPTRRRSSTHLPEMPSRASICDDITRHKRPAPSASPNHDVTMDSPQHKRFKST